MATAPAPLPLPLPPMLPMGLLLGPGLSGLPPSFPLAMLPPPLPFSCLVPGCGLRCVVAATRTHEHVLLQMGAPIVYQLSPISARAPATTVAGEHSVHVLLRAPCFTRHPFHYQASIALQSILLGAPKTCPCPSLVVVVQVHGRWRLAGAPQCRTSRRCCAGSVTVGPTPTTTPSSHWGTATHGPYRL